MSPGKTKVEVDAILSVWLRKFANLIAQPFQHLVTSVLKPGLQLKVPNLVKVLSAVNLAHGTPLHTASQLFSAGVRLKIAHRCRRFSSNTRVVPHLALQQEGNRLEWQSLAEHVHICTSKGRTLNAFKPKVRILSRKQLMTDVSQFGNCGQERSSVKRALRIGNSCAAWTVQH